MTWESFFTQSDITLERIIWPMFIGIALAIAAALFFNRVHGSFIRALLKGGAVNEATSMTLADTGCDTPLMRLLLRRRGGLRRTVSVCGGRADSNPAELRFFIPENRYERASSLYERDAASIITVLIAILIFLGVSLLLLYIVPDLIQMLINFIDSLREA